ncbi:MAG: HEAT repeat domain-containing protein [Planctomycetes bacterium]|nr:HEAT repeat domain-containing protein [Planctomycetota bacterium]
MFSSLAVKGRAPRRLVHASCALAALLAISCDDRSAGPEERSATSALPRHRGEADAQLWLAADETWPPPLPLQGVEGYQLPGDQSAWVERCVAKLSRPLPIEALRYAKEMLGELGPPAVASLGRMVSELRFRRDTESLGGLLHAMAALAFHPREQTWPHLLPVLEHESPLARREALRGLDGCRELALAEQLAGRLIQDPALGRGRILAGQLLSELSRAAGGGLSTGLSVVQRAYQAEERRVFHVDAGDDEMARYLVMLVRTGQPLAVRTMETLARSRAHISLHREIVEQAVLLPSREDALRLLRLVEDDLALDSTGRPLLLPLLRRALAMLGDTEALDHFRKLVVGEDEGSRQVAVQSLGYAGELEPALERLRGDAEATVRMAAANALSFAIRRREKLFPPDEWPAEPLRGACTSELLQALEGGLRDPHPMVREEVARTAALLGAAEVFAPVLEQLRSDDPVERLEALRIVVAPRVHWRPAAAVMLDQLERIPPAARTEWLQATVLLATAGDAPRLVALLAREDPWGDHPAGEIAARYVGDLGRDIAPLLVDAYRAAKSAAAKTRVASVLMIALVGDSKTRRPYAPRYAAPLSEGARFLVEEVLDDPDLPAELRQRLLLEAPRYGGSGVAPLLLRRYAEIPLPPRERAWTLRVLWEYF